MRWNTLTLITCCAISAALYVQNVWAGSVTIKPRTPVQVSITPETAVTPGANATFVIKASSSLASGAFSIAVTVPEGANILSGQLRWQGPIAPGQVRELRFTVHMPADQPPVVSATAAIQSDNSAQLAASAEYRPSSLLPSGITATQHQRKSLRNGHPVVEYSLQ